MLICNSCQVKHGIGMSVARQHGSCFVCGMPKDCGVFNVTAAREGRWNPSVTTRIAARSSHLKPCPFCGQSPVDLMQRRRIDLGPPKFRTNIPQAATTETFFVQCPQCNSRGPKKIDMGHAINDWNGRVDLVS